MTSSYFTQTISLFGESMTVGVALARLKKQYPSTPLECLSMYIHGVLLTEKQENKNE